MTFEALMEKYPEYQEVLKPPLEAAAWLHSRALAFEPRPGFVASSKRRLIKRFRNREISVLGHTLQVLDNVSISFTKIRVRYGFGMLAFLVVIVLMIGFRDVVYASEHSLPGDTLYPIKLAHEKSRLFFSFTKLGDAGLAVEFADRRLGEIQELIILGRTEKLESVVDGCENQVEAALLAITNIAGVNDGAFVALSTELEQILQESYTSLSTLESLVTSGASEDLSEALSIVSFGLGTLESLETVISTTREPAATTTMIPFTPTMDSTSTPSPTGGVFIEQTSVPNGIPAAKTPTFDSGDEDEGDKPAAKATKTPKPKHTPRPTNTHRPTQKLDAADNKNKAP